jgi:hypothetical protein
MLLHSGWAPALLSNIRPSCKDLPRTNTLSYLSSTSEANKKSFMTSTPVRLPDTVISFPKQPVTLMSSASVPARTFVSSLPDKPSGLEPVYVMSSNPLDLATANRKRTLSVTTVIPSSPVIMTHTDSGLAGKICVYFNLVCCSTKKLISCTSAFFLLLVVKQASLPSKGGVIFC